MKSLTSNRGSLLTDDRRSVVSGNSSNASTVIPESVTSSRATPSSQLRKFTAALGKPGLAKEAREVARSIISAQNPTRVPPIAEPVDYEKFVLERSIQLENDPQRDLLLFPRDDVEEVLLKPDVSTEISSLPKEIPSHLWLLTKEALQLYSLSEHVLCFNYAQFSGDYHKITQSLSLENDSTLPSLVFEYDVALDEERANQEGFLLRDVVKEGYMLVVKNDTSILDNLKQAKKRYCILRRSEGGEIVLEVRKTPEDLPKKPPMHVNSAQLRSTKKGKTVLEIEPVTFDDEKEQKPICITSVNDNAEEINSWLQNVNRAIAFSSRADATSSYSERLDRSNEKALDSMADTESITSEDSSTSRDISQWRGRMQAANALKPPIVDRRNIFSLYHSLQPISEPPGQRCSILYGSRVVSARNNSNNNRPRVAFQSSSVSKLMFSLDGVSLKLPIGGGVMIQVEELFASVFLFDAQSGRRISEELHVAVPTERAMRKYSIDGDLKNHRDYALLATLPVKKALCTIARPHKDIWIVCRVDRCLSADISGDVYMKTNPDPKTVVKLQKSLQATAPRLSSYRQRFAWAARPALEDGRSDGLLNGSKEFGQLHLFRCEGNKLTETDLHKALSDFPKFEKNTKLMIPGACVQISVENVNNPADVPCRLSPSLLPLKPWPAKELLSDTLPPILELQSFGDVMLEPHKELINLLYVYPLSLKYDNQKVFSKARNIACSIRFVSGDDQVSAKAVINRLSNAGPFVPKFTCAIQHHQSCPTFGDEIKIKLPLSLSSCDHLLFSFTHVSVAGQSTVKSPEASDIPVGYAWLPLVWKKDRLVMQSDEQEFALPIAAELPSGYLRSKPFGLGKQDDSSEIRWVDQRPLFRFRLRLVSSAFTTDDKLQSFFQCCQKMENKGTLGDATDRVGLRNSKTTSPVEACDRGDDMIAHRSCSPLARSSSLQDSDGIVTDLIRRTTNLQEVPIEKIVPFLPIVLRRLLYLVPKSPTENLALSTLSTIVSIADRCCSEGKKNLLSSFVRLHFELDGDSDESTHAAICRYFPLLLKYAQTSKEDLGAVFRQIWFLLDVVCKSLALNIIRNGLVKAPRRDRVSTDVLEQMGGVVDSIASYLVERHRELPDEARGANTALGYFIRCCLNLIDRGHAFRWIYNVISLYDAESIKVLRDYKADLLSILSQHEHWLPLNLPVLLDGKNQIQRIVYQSSLQDASSTAGASFFTRFLTQLFQGTASSDLSEGDRYSSCTDEWKLSKPYASRHFLIGLLLQELKACLRECRDYRRRPIQILRNIVAKHSFDKRYSDLNIQHRIAVLYAPILLFTVDLLHELRAVVIDTGEGQCGRIQTKGLSLDRRKPSWEPLSLPYGQTPSSPLPPLPERLNMEDIRDLLSTVIFVIQRLPRRILSSIWTESDYVRCVQFLQLFDIIAEVFSYKGKEHAMAISTTENFMSPQKNATLLSLGVGDITCSSLDHSRFDEDAAPLPFGVLQVLNFSQEVALILLDALQTFARTFAPRVSKPLMNDQEQLRDLVMRLLAAHLSFLEDHWPEAVRLHSIAALAVFVNLFRVPLFEGALDALSLLIERVLLLMASRLVTVQNSAAALLQLILRVGYETAQTQFANEAMAISVLPSSSAPKIRQPSLAERLGRPGSQTGVALARLLGQKSVISSSSRFEKGLGALETLLHGDALNKKPTVFDRAVMDLIRQLRGVMVATVALKEAANDAIRLTDLHIQLADSYRGSAALRCTWFDTLASVHANDRWYSEAAVCHAHSVAIMAKELADKGELTLDWNTFDWISKEIAEQERGLAKECNVQPAGFTLESLSSKIEKTAQTLTLSERYEAIGPLYRLLIPSLEKGNNFTNLISIYAELQQSYSRAAEVKTSGKRHLGSYFRIRLYGRMCFGCDDGTEWVYRELGLTSLAEVKQKLELQCISNGYNKVFVTGDEEIDLTNLDAEGAYVQVTHVEPVTEENRPAKDYWSHTNVKRFVYETTYTEEGGDKNSLITNQSLKRVTVEVNGQFPSSRRRLRVISSSEQLFTPLQFACQKLAVKTEQIRSALAGPAQGRSLDVKGLQLVLQGAVMPTVNVGPLAYAEAFTQPDQVEKYGQEGVDELKDAFRALMTACEEALNVNQSVVAADQQRYHQVLVSSYEAMHERLAIFFGESLRSVQEEDAKLPRNALHVLDSISGIHG